jgi:tetratricopeptide (TPR) repeat protein
MSIRIQNGTKRFFLRILILFVIFLFPHISEASEPRSSTIQSLVKVHSDISRGIELLYDWEFDQAESLFYGIIAKNPKDPAGYFYLAMVTWSRLEYGFWSPEMVRQYSKRIDRAVSVAAERIENEKGDSFTYFYLGGALGFKARFQMMQRKWLSSFFLARNAVAGFKTCLKMDPNNKDVLLGFGIFDYYTARLSGVLKFLAYFLIHEGDKYEGLKKLHAAANQSIYSAVEAKSVLLHIYLFMEPLPNKARPLAEELSERFKKNARFIYLQGVTYIRLGMGPEYHEVVGFLNERSHKEDSLNAASIWRNRALYLEASYDLFHGQYDMARSRLDVIISQTYPSSDPAMATWPLLKKGMSYDLGGQREKALTYYQRIVKMKNGGGAQFLAKKYIDSPVKEKDRFLGY